MLRLASRQKSIPNGFRFYLPEVKWKSPPNYPSFDRIVRELLQVIKAHPALAAKHKWPRDEAGVADWVDLYNATLCAKMGWNDYLMPETGGGHSIPKTLAPHQASLAANLKNAAARAKELVAGAKTLMEWDESGQPPVPAEQALERAITCSACPLNKIGTLTEWFERPAAELIRRRVERASARGLTTPRDDALGLCTACACPLRLKVHVPIVWVEKVISPAQKQRMQQGKDCWILREMNRK